MPHRANRYDVITDGGGTQPGKRVGLLHGEEDFEFGITFTVKVCQVELFAKGCVCVCLCISEFSEFSCYESWLLFADEIVIRILVSYLDLQNFKKFDF